MSGRTQAQLSWLQAHPELVEGTDEDSQRSGYTTTAVRESRTKVTNVMMFGCDNAGKTTLSKAFRGENTSHVVRTQGYNVNALSIPDLVLSESTGGGTPVLNLWDIAGQRAVRPYWRNYLQPPGPAAVVFVVDGHDSARHDEALEEFQSLLEIRWHRARWPANRPVMLLVTKSSSDEEIVSRFKRACESVESGGEGAIPFSACTFSSEDLEEVAGATCFELMEQVKVRVDKEVLLATLCSDRWRPHFVSATDPLDLLEVVQDFIGSCWADVESTSKAEVKRRMQQLVFSIPSVARVLHGIAHSAFAGQLQPTSTQPRQRSSDVRITGHDHGSLLLSSRLGLAFCCL